MGWHNDLCMDRMLTQAVSSAVCIVSSSRCVDSGHVGQDQDMTRIPDLQLIDNI